MPTPVSSARQCLTEEAARALDDAVTVARRRSHAQTTSLHAVSALLALPSSTLRDACARARSSAYSPRLQFRALELCVSVSLDRLPSSNSKTLEEKEKEPPVSNSLMAAIKRSQANQRRHPDTFHLYQQQLQTTQSSLSCVKVELKHFILSILDDPIVSRVFGDAGFRSTDIKLAILHPLPISRFQKSRLCPPLFLCDLPNSEPNPVGFTFPFAGFSGDEDCRRIGEILVKKNGRNPLLIGVCANNVVRSFTESIESGKGGFLPAKIDGVNVICIDKEICEFVAGNQSEEMMDSKFKEVKDKVENCTGAGIVVNYGELKVFVDGGSSGGAVDYVMKQLSNLVEVYGGKLWLIGAVGSYETYMKFSAKFTSIEKEWDLNLLPITSSKSYTGGSHLKSSLMGSFVPFGGFFPAPSELENLPSSTNQSVTRCNLCNQKYEHEVSVILNGGNCVSIADQQSTSLPSWLQTPESDTMQAKDHGSMLNIRLVGLQRKWNDICQRLHHGQTSQQDSSQVRSLGANVPILEGFQFHANRVESNGKDSLLNENRCGDFQNTLLPRHTIQLPGSSGADNNSFQHKPPVDFLGKTKHTTTSSSCITSVTTDLGLGTIYVSNEIEQTQAKIQDHTVRIQNISGLISAKVDRINKSPLHQIAKSSECSGPELVGPLFGEKDFKQLFRVLKGKVGRQDDAICTISQTISRCKSGNGRRRGSSHRGDIWLTFLGHDKMGKRKIAAALAEIVFGSKESLISIDLNLENRICHSSSLFDCQDINLNDEMFRGKSLVDYIVEKLSKKPHSVVLLENIDKADFLAQSSLSRAIRTGKLQDTHCREISINNTIFVTTTSNSRQQGEENVVSGKDLSWGYSEERILGAKGLQMRISVESVHGSEINSSSVLLMPRQSTSNSGSENKRKLIIETTDFEISVPAMKKSRSSFDLNLPVDEAEGSDDYGNSENDSLSETQETWLDDFLDQVDEKVVFEPFDFNALAEKILKEFGLSFQKMFGSDVLLEIETEVMVQILASSWLSEKKRAVEDWIETVLRRSFLEAKQKHCVNAQTIVKLVAVEGVPVEEHAPCVCLPERIIVN